MNLEKYQVTNRRILHIEDQPGPRHMPGETMCDKTVSADHLVPYPGPSTWRVLRNEKRHGVYVAIHGGEQRKLCHLCMNGGELD